MPLLDGRLYYVGPKKEEKREVVIEPETKRQIFLDCHFNDIGQHLGQKKTVHRIQSKYYWLGIVKDVVDWVTTWLRLTERLAALDTSFYRQRTIVVSLSSEKYTLALVESVKKKKSLMP